MNEKHTNNMPYDAQKQQNSDAVTTPKAAKPPRRADASAARSPKPPRRILVAVPPTEADGTITVPAADSTAFIELVESLQAAGICCVPCNASGLPMLKKTEDNPRPVASLTGGGLVTTDNRWNRAEVIGVRLGELVLVDIDGNHGTVDPEQRAVLTAGAVRVQWREDADSEHWLMRIEDAEGLKHSNDGGAAANIDIKRGNQLQHIKPGKRLNLVALLNWRKLPPANAAILTALRNGKAKKPAAATPSTGKVQAITSAQLAKAERIINELGAEHFADRENWLRACGFLRNCVGTEHEDKAMQLADAIDDGEGTTWDKVLSERAADPKGFLGMALELAGATKAELELGDDAPRKVSCAIGELGDWAVEKHAGKRTYYALASDGVVSDAINEARGHLLASQHETMRGEHGGIYAYNREQGIWQPWTTICADLAAEAKRQCKALDADPENFNTGAKWLANTVAALRGKLHNKLVAPVEGLVPFANGVLHTRGEAAGMFVPHKPEMWLLNTNGIIYGGATPTPHYDRFMAFAANGSELRQRALEAMLYTILTGDMSQKVFFELIGASNSGKSVMSTLATELAGGMENVLTTDLRTLSSADAGKFVLGDLPKKRLILMAEQESGRYPVGVIKRLTGEDAVSVEAKSMQPIAWVNRAPLLITGNTAMVFKGESTQAIVNRRIMLPMDAVVPEAEQDRQLRDKLLTEIGGIARHLMDTWNADKVRATLVQWRKESTAADDRMRELDDDFDFAAMLVPVLRSAGPINKVAWVIGSEPKDEELRQRRVVPHNRTGLYPLYCHYRKANGTYAGRLSARMFAKQMLNHLRTLHRNNTDLIGDELELITREQSGIGRTMMWWKPSSELLAMLDCTRSEYDELSDD